MWCMSSNGKFVAVRQINGFYMDKILIATKVCGRGYAINLICLTEDGFC